MGNLEAEEGGNLIQTTAEKRMGKPEELGFAIATGQSISNAKRNRIYCLTTIDMIQ